MMLLYLFGAFIAGILVTVAVAYMVSELDNNNVNINYGNESKIQSQIKIGNDN